VSFSDRPTVPPVRIIGCLLYILLTIPVMLYSMIYALLGRCDSDGFCLPVLYYLALFPGLLIAVLVGGIFLARWATKGGE
jgi:hypothetical protein